jgi:membrane-associated phospholipid phosphatase
VTAARAEEGHDTVRTLGDIGQYAVPGSALALALARRDGAGVKQLALASAVSMAIVYTLKPTVDRRRPTGGGQSFPSGHTTFAFTGAAFLQRRYGWAYGAPAYAVSAFVGWSRVHTDEHWSSDVLAGAALGIASGLVFARPFEGVVVTPTASHGGPGLAMTLTW